MYTVDNNDVRSFFGELEWAFYGFVKNLVITPIIEVGAV